MVAARMGVVARVGVMWPACVRLPGALTGGSWNGPSAVWRSPWWRRLDVACVWWQPSLPGPRHPRCGGSRPSPTRAAHGVVAAVLDRPSLQSWCGWSQVVMSDSMWVTAVMAP